MADKKLIQKIQKANPHWLKHVQNETSDFQYDREADILYVAFGPRREAVSVPLDIPGDEVYLRVSPDTYEITGYDIFNFRANYLKNHPEGQQVFEPLFNLLGDMDWRIQLKPLPDTQKAKVKLLLPASYKAVRYLPEVIRKALPDLVAA